MKRASLIAPLILILIGGIFLLNNVRPDLSIWRLMASYWPWLLVGLSTTTWCAFSTDGE